MAEFRASTSAFLWPAIAIGCVFAQSEKPAVLDGLVVDSVTGAPVRKASVRLMRVSTAPEGTTVVESGPASAVTDNAGRFNIPRAAAGQYRLTGEATGYERGEYGARNSLSPGVHVVISPGQELKDLTIRLVPQATVRGRILDDAGDPVHRATVMVMVSQYRRGRRVLAYLSSAQSDDTGRYRVENVRPGRHYVMVASPPEMGLARTYYPGVKEFAQAGRVVAAAGMETPAIDLRVKRERGVRVSGAVLDGNGRAFTNGWVILAPQDVITERGLGGTWLRADGTFEIRNVTPGSYMLRAAVAAGETIEVQAPVEVRDRDVAGVALTAWDPRPARGNVVAVGVEAKLLNRARLRLERVDGIPGSSPLVRLAEDSSVVFPKVFPALYRLTLFNGPTGAHVSAIKAGGREFQGCEVDFSGGVPEALEIVLAMDGGSIAGTVFERDQAYSGALVTLAPEDRLRARGYYSRVTRSLESGTFAFMQLPPGTYTVLAWEEVESGSWDDPDVLRQYGREGAKVTLAPRGSESVRLNIIPARSSR